VLLFKMALKQQLIQKEMILRASDAGSTATPFTKWVDQDVAHRMASFQSWMDEERAGDLIWRTSRSASELRWLSLVEEAIFGKTWDTAIRIYVKNSVAAADALNQGALAEELSAINVQRQTEQAQVAPAAEPASSGDAEPVTHDLSLTTVDTNGQVRKVDINFDNLTEVRRETLQTQLTRTRKTIATHITLLPRTVAGGLGAALARTALGKLQGSLDATNPSKNRYVAIIYDAKNIGEATHRPKLRTPPQQRDSKTLGELITTARSRVATPKTLSGEDAAPGSLDLGDIYFILDGGMAGNEALLMKPFAGKDKTTKKIHILKDQDSVDRRHERVRGIGNIQQMETLHLVTATPITLPPMKYEGWPGGTGGNAIGPVVLQGADEQWNATWAEKKLIYGPENFIDVGGKLEADMPEHTRKKQRTDECMEPVFFHSLPEHFWLQMITCFNIIGVIDLCAGEGVVALACYRKNIPYLGICFNDQHQARLLAHLEKTILSCMTKPTDSLYDVKFTEAVAGQAAVCAVPKAMGKAKAKAAPKAAPAAPAAQVQVQDPFADEPAETEEGHMSGDGA
jgi:hypothetical protein